MERRLLHLECPSDQRCDLGSDLRFCRGSVKYVLFFSLFSLFFLFSFFFLLPTGLGLSELESEPRQLTDKTRLLMQRRREHIECESRPGLGCLIYGTRTCPHARKLKTRLRKWARGRSLDPVRWMLIMSLVPMALGWVWVLGAMLF